MKSTKKMQEYDISTDFDDIVHHRINDQILAHADAVMTDTWKSMGEDTKNQDYDLIKEFRVTEKVMKRLNRIVFLCTVFQQTEMRKLKQV